MMEINIFGGNPRSACVIAADVAGSTHYWVEAMRAGRFADAWTFERQTIADRDPATRDDPSLPYHLRWVWDGRAFDDRDVLVRCYHGLGDTIQYARYLPVLRQRAASVTLEVQPRLIGLLTQLPGVDRIIPFDVAHPTPSGDCDIEISELPCALQRAPDVVPVPYLSWPPAEVAPGTIGLCHTAGDWDVERSIAPLLLSPICQHFPTVTLVAAPTDLPVANPAGCPFSIEDTAAIIASLSLVVTVDTMIAHLAGAMGKPVWLLLKAAPDWRWSPDRRDTPWYPLMRLYAQPSPGDWTSVLAAVATDLATAFPKDRSPAGWPA